MLPTPPAARACERNPEKKKKKLSQLAIFAAAANQEDQSTACVSEDLEHDLFEHPTHIQPAIKRKNLEEQMPHFGKNCTSDF